ncbi:MAG TPA: alpha/beta fold hydrolase, partial [Pseudomonadales bacterium]|nr:alpha/beta fold hydrolase [Pseudomonadales bacterium]
MTQEPAWYRDAITTPFVEGVVEVAGCPIHYQHWSNPGAPALLLVHGYAAHSHWWDFIAPLLLDQYQVVALDISGCGESGHRD